MTFTRTRFAPAPTGLLHLGHVVSAIHVWGLGRARGAGVLLRIEDHDRQRSRPAFEQALLDDLDWLGFRPDHFPTDAFRTGPCPSRQRDRDHHYADAARGLAARGLLYGCRCSRRDWSRAGTDAPGAGWCPRGCRVEDVPLGAGVAWRLLMPGDRVAFDDLLVGACEQDTARDGDLIVRDRLGNWTYQFAVTVDDWHQDIDLVIRGRDLLTSTARQIVLATCLGRPTPATFAHHGLVMKTATRKLSKADGDTGVRDLRAAGWSPERVIGEAAARAGLAPAGSRISADEAPDLFR